MHILWNNVKVNPLIFVLRCCCMNYLMIKQYLISSPEPGNLMSHSETVIRWSSLNCFLFHRHKKIITLFEKCSCTGFTLLFSQIKVQLNTSTPVEGIWSLVSFHFQYCLLLLPHQRGDILHCQSDFIVPDIPLGLNMSMIDLGLDFVNLRGSSLTLYRCEVADVRLMGPKQSCLIQALLWPGSDERKKVRWSVNHGWRLGRTYSISEYPQSRT